MGKEKSKTNHTENQWTLFGVSSNCPCRKIYPLSDLSWCTTSRILGPISSRVFLRQCLYVIMSIYFSDSADTYPNSPLNPPISCPYSFTKMISGALCFKMSPLRGYNPLLNNNRSTCFEWRYSDKYYYQQKCPMKNRNGDAITAFS